MKFFRHRYYRPLFSILISLCLFLQACSFQGAVSQKGSQPASETSKAFTTFTDTIFRESISSDALSLNYTLAEPENYGVSPHAGGFTPISYDAAKNSAPEAENLLATLQQFDKDLAATK